MTHCRLSLVGQAVLVFVMVLAVGCGNTAKPVEEAEIVFYPPAPDLPRLQFLMSFSDADRWLKKDESSGVSSFTDFIIGTNKEEAEDTVFSRPYGLGVRDGKLYVCDVDSSRIHVVNMKDGTYSTLGKPKQLRKPVNITFGPNGLAYVCDMSLRKVAVFDSSDRFVKYLGQKNNCAPADLAILGDELIVIDAMNKEVQAWSMDGKFIARIARKGTLPGELAMPTNLAVSSDGRIFVADTAASIVNVYNRKGTYLRPVGSPGDRPGFFARPKGVAIDPSGILYVTDAHWEVIQMFSAEGGLLLFFGGPNPKKPSGMSLPAGVIIDKTALPLFQSYIDPDFNAEYLVFLANQHGPNKICVYAYGKSKTGKYIPIKHDPKATKAPPPKPGKKREVPKESGAGKTPQTPTS